jgi:hypothetical protein
MALPFMPYIEINGICRIKILHKPGQIGLGRFNHKMIMIVHQHIRVEIDPVLLFCFTAIIEKFPEISII